MPRRKSLALGRMSIAPLDAPSLGPRKRESVAKPCTADPYGVHGKKFASLPRRHSVEILPEDWPTQADVGETKKELGEDAADEGSKRIKQLVEDLRTLEVAFPVRDFNRTVAEIRAHGLRQQSAGQPAETLDEDDADTDRPGSPGSGSRPASRAKEKRISFSGGRLRVDPMNRTGAPIVNVDIIKVHLPNPAELRELPGPLQSHLKDVAEVTLQVFFAPIILMRYKRQVRQRLVLAQAGVAPPLSVNFLSQQQLFRVFPDDKLKQVIEAARLTVYDRHELVSYEGEPPTRIIFLATGSVQLLKRKTRGNKKLSGNNIEVLQTCHAPCVLAEFSLLTEQPWAFTVKALARCEFWELNRENFNRITIQIPQSTMNPVIKVAFQQRNDAMSRHYPMSVATLRSHSIFALCTDDCLAEVSMRLEPHAVPKNFLLCKKDEKASAMLFLRQGHVGVYKTVKNEQHLVKSLKAPLVIGDTALVHGSEYDSTIRTTSDSDIWLFSKMAFQTTVRMYPKDLDAMLDAAREQKQEELNANQDRYRSVVQQIPLVRDVLPPHLVKPFVRLLQPRVYRPLNSVCSNASFCDRLIIVTKGKIMLGKNKDNILSNNQCIGWSCVVPHRWAMPALSLESTVECLEVSCTSFIAFLKENGLYNKMLRLTKVLLFPKAFDPQEVEAVKARVSATTDLPPMYPVGKSRYVNLNEMGFCTANMSVLLEQQKKEKVVRMEEEAKAKAAASPLAEKSCVQKHWRPLTSGLYVPMTRYPRAFRTV